MRTLLGIILLACYFAVPAIAEDKEAAGEVKEVEGNLLKNGTFEDGKAAWTFYQDSAHKALPSLSETVAHTGKKAAKITGSGEETGNGGVISQTVPVEPGGIYQLSAWAMAKELAAGGNNFASISVVFIVGGESRFDTASRCHQPGTDYDWLPLKLMCEAPKGVTHAAIELRFFDLGGDKSAGTVYFDDVVFKKR